MGYNCFGKKGYSGNLYEQWTARKAISWRDKILSKKESYSTSFNTFAVKVQGDLINCDPENTRDNYSGVSIIAG